MTKARDLASLLSGSGSGTIAPALVSDQLNTSTGFFQVSKGATGERPISPATGMLRYNTTLDVLEQYGQDGWVGIEPAPTISSVTPPAGQTAVVAGESVTIAGTGFKTGIVVKFIATNGTNYTAATTTRVSSSELTAELPSGIPDGSYNLSAANPSGLAGTFDNAVTVDDAPVFGISGTLGTFVMGASVSIDFSVTETGSTPTLTLASGSLPPGLSLSGQVLSGVLSDVQSDTAHSFTIRATDAEGQTTDLACTLTVQYAYSQEQGALFE